MVIIMNGKKVAEKMLLAIKKEVELLETKPSLSVILVGDDEASMIYVKKKEIACKKVGINFNLHTFPKNVSEKQIIKLIKKINNEPHVNGIITQLPLPKHISGKHIFETINPLKDVDCFSPINRWKLLLGEKSILPCTPFAVIKILEEYNIELEEKNVVLIGRSYLVGQPLALMLMHKNATVTICHSKTKNIAEHTKKADIVVSAVGNPRLINGNMINEGAVVVDVGISRFNDSVIGDVDFESVKNKASYVAKVPGGVGPVTVSSVLWNTLECYKKQI